MSGRRARAERAEQRAEREARGGLPSLREQMTAARRERDEALGALNLEYTPRMRALHEEWVAKRKKVWRACEERRGTILAAEAEAKSEVQAV